MFLPAPRFLAIAGAVTLGLFAGCMSPSPLDSARTGPFYQLTNYTGDAQLPANLRRVVLLPVSGGTVAPLESAQALDPVFLAELQKQNRFEVVPLSRAECRSQFHADEFRSTAALPHDFVAIVQRDHDADGVLFVDLTVYHPYRPLSVGVRAKLATLHGDVRLLWTFDNVFSAADAAVANSARQHFLESDRGGVPYDLTPGVLQSPTRFAAYVASEVFRTLPPVYGRPKKPAGNPAAKMQPR